MSQNQETECRSAPKLYIKMKKCINANHFLVSVRSGLTLDYSEGGTKFLQNAAVKFHSHLLMKIKPESATSPGTGGGSVIARMTTWEPPNHSPAEGHALPHYVILQQPIRIRQKGRS